MSPSRAAGASGWHQCRTGLGLAAEPDSRYRCTKWLAERVIEEDAAAWSALRAVLIRAALLCGTSASGIMRRPSKAAPLGLPLPLGRRTNNRTPLSVTNLASAIRAVCHHDCAPSSVSYMSDSPLVSTSDLDRWGQEASGQAGCLLTASPEAMKFAARSVGRADAAAPHFDDVAVDATTFREAFAWSPVTATANTIWSMVRGDVNKTATW